MTPKTYIEVKVQENEGVPKADNYLSSTIGHCAHSWSQEAKKLTMLKKIVGDATKTILH